MPALAKSSSVVLFALAAQLGSHAVAATDPPATQAATRAVAASFGDDLAFLRRHTNVVLLQDDAKQAQVIVAPAWQGRVMSSTARGDGGDSFGWVNRALIQSGKVEPHINVFGGEDRLWLGPEGGQFSIFFAKGVPFDLAHWYTPPALDTEPFEIVEQTPQSVACRRELRLTNYSGTQFNLTLDRTVRLVPTDEAMAAVGAQRPDGVSAVAFESINTITNTGDAAWTKRSGLLSIWILGMFNASPQATVVIPFVEGDEAKLGPIVNDAYFGKVPADRLAAKDDVLFFRADGQHRTKIGLSPQRAKPVIGSYDAANRTLTLVAFDLPAGQTDYVNSMWELQKEPFAGDAVNSYNDDGKLGNFFELESSSPALALRPGASATHRHRTIHLQGDEKDLDAIAQRALGVRLDAVRNAFKQ